MTQGYFEVSQFHSTPVALFDSHWFANRIQETHGDSWMCMEIRQASEDYANIEKDFVLGPASCYAAMMPYRDFRASHRRPEAEECSSLVYLFQLEEPPKFLHTYNFRLETARRMLAAPPIRYCIPLHNEQLVRVRYHST